MSIASTRWLWPVVACASVALTLLLPAGPGMGDRVGVVDAFGAAAAVIFGVPIAVVAWRAGEWSPTLLAVGCLSMVLAVVVFYLFSEAGIALGRGAGAGSLPLLGLLTPAAWYGLSVHARWPAITGGTPIRAWRW